VLVVRVVPAVRTLPQTVLDDPAAYRDDLLDLALDAGLDAAGVTPAVAWPDARQRLEDRRAAGYDAGMPFTYRDPARATDPTRSLPDARALLGGAVGYRRRPPEPAGGPTGRVAAYAWTQHDAPLRSALKAVAARLKADGWRARVLIDDNGLVDREAAHRAGIGWFGKNANLLLPGRGSWFVLGSVLTSAPLPPSADPVPDGCGSCRRCLDGCPTGAIVEPGVVDAGRCLSWLLQVDGDFPRPFREVLGDRIYGCDDCQEVCPPNRRAEADEPPPPAEPGSIASVDILGLLAAADDELLARHGRWYLPRRDPDHLRRNALVVLGNTGAAAPGSPAAGAVGAVLGRYLRHPNAVLRGHAAWAARRLGRPELLDGLGGDAAVADELAQPAPEVVDA
jgi:epoxyqueuosine reductase